MNEQETSIIDENFMNGFLGAFDEGTASDQTADVPTGENAPADFVNTDTSDTAEPPATGDGEGPGDTGAVSPDGEVTPPDTPDAVEPEDKTEPKTYEFRYTHNHKGVEERLTEAEIIDRFQRLRAAEDRANKQRFEELTEEYTAAFPAASDDIIKDLVTRRMDGYEPPPAENADKMIADIQAFRASVPDAPAVIPAEVMSDYNKGVPLETAYLRYEMKAAKAEAAAAKATAAKAKKEAAIARQNANAARRAPVKGVTGGGSEPPIDPFMKGFLNG